LQGAAGIICTGILVLSSLAVTAGGEPVFDVVALGAKGTVRDHARAGIEDFPRQSHRVPGALRFPKDHRPGMRAAVHAHEKEGDKDDREAFSIAYDDVVTMEYA
jgi:hypothetical protein